MAQLLSNHEIEEWLAGHGLSTAQIDRVRAGIDLAKPFYLQTLWPGDKLIQFRDRVSAEFPFGSLGGQWFALPSLGLRDMGRLAIGSGLAGRTRHELRVIRKVEVLESTAAPMLRHPTDRYCGPGGATQIFIPDGGRASLA
jgi:hypothetical protein